MEEKNKFLATFAEWEPVVYLPFEKDVVLPAGVETHGKLYAVDGLKGQGMRFDDGFLTVPYQSVEDGYSLMCWVCADNVGKTTEGIITAIGSSCEDEKNSQESVLKLLLNISESVQKNLPKRVMRALTAISL